MGHWAWALGIGHRAWGIGYSPHTSRRDESRLYITPHTPRRDESRLYITPHTPHTPHTLPADPRSPPYANPIAVMIKSINLIAIKGAITPPKP
ncbi:hypothetical protein BLD44_009015 [Mastigocladus laminosus UU774]|nr:hypothetical protein BLD44_009015 [Mastigocladus laminosus UU774]